MLSREHARQPVHHRDTVTEARRIGLLRSRPFLFQLRDRGGQECLDSVQGEQASGPSRVVAWDPFDAEQTSLEMICDGIVRLLGKRRELLREGDAGGLDLKPDRLRMLPVLHRRRQPTRRHLQ